MKKLFFLVLLQLLLMISKISRIEENISIISLEIANPIPSPAADITNFLFFKSMYLKKIILDYDHLCLEIRQVPFQ